MWVTSGWDQQLNKVIGDKMASQKFQNALIRKAQKVPPIWMMRQAGRYHKHYQALRQKHSFMELCKEPELAAEVAFGPVNEFDFDVSILFSDLLFPLEALGMGLEYTDSGPKLGWHLNPENMSKLRPWQDALSGLQFQKEAMKLTRERIPQDKSVIGFVGGPWTLFVYAVEGGHSGSLALSKKWHPLFSTFCEIMVPLLKENIRLQFEGGAEVVMVLDTAAGELSPEIYHSLVKPELNKIKMAYPGKLGYYSKTTNYSYFNPNFWDNSLWAGKGIDHRWNFKEALLKNKSGFLQGNFDQALLHCDPEVFQKLLQEYLAPLKDLSEEQRAGWVCGLGHGIIPKTPEVNVKWFVRLVREAFQ